MEPASCKCTVPGTCTVVLRVLEYIFSLFDALISDLCEMCDAQYPVVLQHVVARVSVGARVEGRMSSAPIALQYLYEYHELEWKSGRCLSTALGVRSADKMDVSNRTRGKFCLGRT